MVMGKIKCIKTINGNTIIPISNILCIVHNSKDEHIVELIDKTRFLISESTYNKLTTLFDII